MKIANSTFKRGKCYVKQNVEQLLLLLGKVISIKCCTKEFLWKTSTVLAAVSLTNVMGKISLTG